MVALEATLQESVGVQSSEWKQLYCAEEAQTGPITYWSERNNLATQLVVRLTIEEQKNENDTTKLAGNASTT